MRLLPATLLLALCADLPALAQNTITPLNQLIAANASLTAGPLTFSKFLVPPIPPETNVGVRPPLEFGDIGVSVAANPDGTVLLSFVGIDPATGAAREIAVSAAGAKELVRWFNYTFTVDATATAVTVCDGTPPSLQP